MAQHDSSQLVLKGYCGVLARQVHHDGLHKSLMPEASSSWFLMTSSGFLWVGLRSPAVVFFNPSTPCPPILILSDIFGHFIPSGIGRCESTEALPFDPATVAETLAWCLSAQAFSLHAYCLTHRVTMFSPCGANMIPAAFVQVLQVAVFPEDLRVISNDGTFLTSTAALASWRGQDAEAHALCGKIFARLGTLFVGGKFILSRLHEEGLARMQGLHLKKKGGPMVSK